MLYRIDREEMMELTASKAYDENLNNSLTLIMHGGGLVPVEPDYEAAAQVLSDLFDGGEGEFVDYARIEAKRIVDAALKGDTT